MFTLVTAATASERKSRVKRLKTKKLAEFIQKTQQQILEKRSREERRSLKKTSIGSEALAAQRQPAEYQKIDMDALDSSILEAGLYDDKPLLFFGKEMYTKQIVSNPEHVNTILKSFQSYRDIIESMENERHVEGDLDSFGYVQVMKFFKCNAKAIHF